MPAREDGFPAGAGASERGQCPGPPPVVAASVGRLPSWWNRARFIDEVIEWMAVQSGNSACSCKSSEYTPFLRLYICSKVYKRYIGFEILFHGEDLYLVKMNCRLQKFREGSMIRKRQMLKHMVLVSKGKPGGLKYSFLSKASYRCPILPLLPCWKAKLDFDTKHRKQRIQSIVGHYGQWTEADKVPLVREIRC